MSSTPPMPGADLQEKADWLESDYGIRFRALMDEATELVDGQESQRSSTETEGFPLRCLRASASLR